jgi:hypothetical protein
MPYHGGAPRVRREKERLQTGTEAGDESGNTNDGIDEMIINKERLIDIAVTAAVTASVTAAVNQVMK